MRNRGFIPILIPIVIIIAVGIFFAIKYIKPQNNNSFSAQNPQNAIQYVLPSPTPNFESPTPVQKITFCNQYGTYEVDKSTLLDTYITGPGDTMRIIARLKLGDETKVAGLFTVNPDLAYYQVDEVLPLGLKVYIPNDKYAVEGVTSYMKARGNIAFNKEGQPFFGVNAPNSGTGPFNVTNEIKDKLVKFKEGDCVDVIYGSRGYDPQKVVFDILGQ